MIKIQTENMEIFWNNRFIANQFIWGFEPCNTAIICKKIFKKYDVKNILIMGAGYGRNGKYFTDNDYIVDGIEISEEAINIGKTFAPKINFIKGSILDINLNKKYDAVFCYDIMQLFLKEEREIIIENCIKHCKNNGIIIISCLSDKDMLFNIGKEIEKNTFVFKEQLTIHFSNKEEMNNLNEKLEIIQLEYSKECEKNKGTEKERNRIIGVYKMTE
jgi:2-polyprenyl-3-methyl-5-hydroxy-6-metoxy-1,4-benzoquinol methylase